MEFVLMLLFIVALATIIGIVILVVIHLLDKSLIKYCSKKAYRIILTIIASVFILLYNILYLPAPNSYPTLASIAYDTQFALLLLFIPIIIATIFFIPSSWFWLKVIVKKEDEEQFVLRKKAALLSATLVAIILLHIPLSNYMIKYAMSRADKMIAYIENYKHEHKTYPDTININQFKSPNLLCTGPFLYEKNDSSYFISFSFNNQIIDAERYVYDPNTTYSNIYENVIFGKQWGNGWRTYYLD